MAGWIRIDRATFDHKALKGPSDWGIWVWLIGEACWKPTEMVIAGEARLLQRGQLSHSIRFLSRKFGLSNNGTQGVLKRFQKWDLIEFDTGTGQTVITICNYDKYQEIIPQQGQQGDAKGTEPGRQGDAVGTKKNNKQNNNKQASESTTVDSIVASAPDEVRDAYDFYVESVEDYNASKATDALPLPKPTKLSDKRRREFIRALKDLPKGRTFAEVVAKAGKCPFLLGENERGWVIHLDFILQKGKFQEILDGKYPERPAAGAPGVHRGQRVAGADLFTEN
ncbi:hypothetical protein PsAD5_02143 [Pseudovibrio sp. Ad5]|uniref:hypothetical protein n=1 Tax=Pseudovibrio sp. Ad5 TaxID=989436 RepID=UPI0007AE7DB8|nr:hypothetical protein [Pseudovibrio sp. Ad5]KZK97904.1 hypothetical protein PsAD5_02143 [Pseudovibrio sp. Ad5]